MTGFKAAGKAMLISNEFKDSSYFNRRVSVKKYFTCLLSEKIREPNLRRVVEKRNA
jgi:hypothetical protein